MKRPRVLSKPAEQALIAHDWPGNLRELRFEMQRATVLAQHRLEIGAQDLASFGQRSGADRERPTTLHQRVEELERREIEAALAKLHGNRTRAAEDLGLSRQGLLKKMSRYGLD